MLMPFLLLLMQGCVSKSTTPTPDINTQNLSKETEGSESNPKLSNLVGKNYIKGIVTTLKRDNQTNAWNYVIEGIDTTNGKLPYVNFNHKTVVANEGDLVHASFNGNTLTEMLVIKANYFKGGKFQDVVLRKKPAADKGPGKRDKAHQVLSVPQEEYIKLN